MSRIRESGWLIAALAIGALCRLWDLTGQSLFIDEGWVFHISSGSPREILSAVANTDFHPPLFYLVTKALEGWLRWPLWDYRYFTAAFSLFGIAGTWSITRRFYGNTAAAFAAMALALQPALIQWDRLYRMYAVLVSLAVISWWLLLKAADAKGRARPIWWGLYLLSVLALPYTHYVGALVVLSQGVYAATRLRSLWPALVCDCLAGLATIPWWWAVRVQYPHGGLVASIHSPTFSWLSLIRATLTAGLPASWLAQPTFDWLFGASALCLLVAGIVVTRGSIVPYWLLPVLFQVVGSFATGKDLVIPRYLYVYVPAFCIVFGAVCASILATRFRLAALALAAMYFGIAAIGIPNLLFVPYYQFADWYQINALMLLNEHPNDIIVLDQGAEYWIVHDYSGFRRHEIEAPALQSDLTPVIHWIDGYPQRRVWYIENQPAFTDPRRRIERHLDETRRALRIWRQDRVFREDSVFIVLYGPRAPAAGIKRVVTTKSP